MQSLIIYGGTTESRQDHIINNYNPQDYIILHIAKEKSSITIKQIQSLSPSTATIPVKDRIIWIEDANLMTSPAQNALLKILEEPPTKTSFILTTSNHMQLLPTVRSRCTLKRLVNPKIGVLNQSSLTLIKEAMSANPGQRILSAQSLGKDRAEVANWFTDIIISLEESLPKTTNAKQLQIIQKILQPALESHQKLTSNCNVTLTTEQFFLSLPISG